MLVKAVGQLVGKTPMLQMSRGKHRLSIKLEQLNPGGSIKDRLGFYLVEEALKAGLIRPGETLIEATAGNTGIGLALACQQHDLQLVVTVPEKFSVEKQIVMAALGAKVVPTPTDKGMDGAIEEAEKWLADHRAHYMPNQFQNPWNPAAYEKLADEIWEETDGKVEVFVAGGGSGGTFSGVIDRLRHYNPAIRGILVQPTGSGLISSKHDYAIEGIGMDQLTPFMDAKEIDAIVEVTDAAAFAATRGLARHHGLLVGSSSGAVFAAAEQLMEEAMHPQQIVTIFPDGAERYLQSGIYGRSRT